MSQVNLPIPTHLPGDHDHSGQKYLGEDSCDEKRYEIIG